MGFFKNIKKIQKTFEKIEKLSKEQPGPPPKRRSIQDDFGGYNLDPDYMKVEGFKGKATLVANKCSVCGMRKLRMFTEKDEEATYTIICICGNMGPMAVDDDQTERFNEAIDGWNYHNPAESKLSD